MKAESTEVRGLPRGPLCAGTARRLSGFGGAGEDGLFLGCREGCRLLPICLFPLASGLAQVGAPCSHLERLLRVMNGQDPDHTLGGRSRLPAQAGALLGTVGPDTSGLPRAGVQGRPAAQVGTDTRPQGPGGRQHENQKVQHHCPRYSSAALGGALAPGTLDEMAVTILPFGVVETINDTRFRRTDSSGFLDERVWHPSATMLSGFELQVGAP